MSRTMFQRGPAPDVHERVPGAQGEPRAAHGAHAALAVSVRHLPPGARPADLLCECYTTTTYCDVPTGTIRCLI